MTRNPLKPWDLSSFLSFSLSLSPSLSLCLSVNVYLYRQQAYRQAGVQIHIYIYTYIYTHIQIHIHMHTYTQRRICTYTHIRIYTYTHIVNMSVTVSQSYHSIQAQDVPTHLPSTCKGHSKWIERHARWQSALEGYSWQTANTQAEKVTHNIHTTHTDLRTYLRTYIHTYITYTHTHTYLRI